jgi:hypothetical protein
MRTRVVGQNLEDPGLQLVHHYERLRRVSIPMPLSKVTHDAHGHARAVRALQRELAELDDVHEAGAWMARGGEFAPRASAFCEPDLLLIHGCVPFGVVSIRVGHLRDLVAVHSASRVGGPICCQNTVQRRMVEPAAVAIVAMRCQHRSGSGGGATHHCRGARVRDPNACQTHTQEQAHQVL